MRILVSFLTVVFPLIAGLPFGPFGEEYSQFEAQAQNGVTQAQEKSIILSTLAEENMRVQAKHEGLSAQKISIHHLRRLADSIELYKIEHGRTPNGLEDLAPNYLTHDGLEERILDGWGRHVYYSATRSDFTLICFGLDGAPNPQTVTWPGGYTASFDFDADIIMINSKWAQTPEGLAR